MNEWNPISTAPTEGDCVLTARHVRSKDQGQTEIWVQHVAYFSGGEWYTVVSGGRPIVKPTHWQRLPEPPK